MEKEDHTILWILMLGFALFISLIYDHSLLRAITSSRSVLLSFYFIQFARIFTVPVIIGVITLFLLRQRKLIVPWLITAVTVLFFTLALKAFISQPRPYIRYDDIIALTRESLYSFPSTRTAIAFSSLPLLAKYFPRFFPFWIFFALLIAFSRLYLGVHFVSDIAGGILLGYFIGKMIVMSTERTSRA